MMRLQRVGRKNDPSFRLVVVDKRTGPKSNKNIDVLGSYNPKMNHVQIDAEKAKVWLTKGVQPSDTVHNILVGQKVIEAKKKNVLPKKSPIVDEEALKREADEKAAAEAKAKESEAEKEASDAESTEAPSSEEAADETATEDTEAPLEEKTEEPASGEGSEDSSKDSEEKKAA